MRHFTPITACIVLSAALSLAPAVSVAQRGANSPFPGGENPDGSLKPHARVLQDFARAAPRVLAAPVRAVALPGSTDDYYRAPLDTLIALYQTF